MTQPRKPVAPGEGERRAQRGYVPQYDSAAAAIYAALKRDDLTWVGLADRGAGANYGDASLFTIGGGCRVR